MLLERQGETGRPHRTALSTAAEPHSTMQYLLQSSLFAVFALASLGHMEEKAQSRQVAWQYLRCPFLGMSGISLPLIICRCSFTGNNNGTQVQSCCWLFNHSVIWAKSEQSCTTKHWQVACTGAPAASTPAELAKLGGSAPVRAYPAGSKRWQS